MKDDFIYLNFKTWLAKNIHRFNVKPILNEPTKESFSVTFKEAPDIEVIFTKSSVDICARLEGFEHLFEGENLYPITDLVLVEDHAEQGYFCSFCSPRKYFQDRASLWEDHVYEELLCWVNEKLKAEGNICFYEFESGNDLKIFNDGQLEKDSMKKFRVLVKPIFKG